jgi:hypothetical protein
MTTPILTASAGTPPGSPDWIACRGTTRSVVDGVVVCPEGSFSPWAHCLNCRYLEGAEDDRDRERSCHGDPVDTATEDRIEPPVESWARLVIELL